MSAEDAGVSTLAPTIGLLAAGLGVVVTFLPGPGTDGVVAGMPVALLAQGLGVLAVVGFSLRRQGVLGPRAGGALAGAASLGLVAGGVFAMVGAVSVWRQPWGVPLVAIAGGLAAGMGLADLRRLDERRLVTVFRGLARALALSVAAFFAASLVGAIITGMVLPNYQEAGFGARYLVSTIGVTVGFLAVAAVVYRATDRPRSALDLALPGLRDLAWVVVGFVVLQVGLVAINQVLVAFDIPFAPSQVQRQAEQVQNPTFVLVLIPLSWLAIAPGEELVYRNIVQRDLYGSMGRIAAVIAASAIFASIHLFQYASQQAAATLVSLAVVFVLALVLGLVYERTDNLAVPILLHGTFNAVSFWQIYVVATAG